MPLTPELETNYLRAAEALEDCQHFGVRIKECDAVLAEDAVTRIKARLILGIEKDFGTRADDSYRDRAARLLRECVAKNEELP